MLSDLIVDRQCEEMSTDDELSMFEESQLDEAFNHPFTSKDVMAIERWLGVQQTYAKLQDPNLPAGLKPFFIKKLANLLQEWFVQRQQSWTNQDWDNWYAQQEREYDQWMYDDEEYSRTANLF